MYNYVQNMEPAVREIPFTEFRRNAAALLDAVEKGERIRVLRHGRPVADVVPVARPRAILSWKRPGLLLEADGASLSREILAERKRGRR
jgi:prevent-host-death family protein